jgi:methylenetetrahydrofolate reductase (NADPH)
VSPTTSSLHQVIYLLTQVYLDVDDRIERMAGLGPEFVDITWNAGGRTSDLTAQLVKTVHTYFGLETCMHLTCTNMPREKVDTALREAKKFGCRNILALRGDPPAGASEWEPQ